MLFLYPRTLHTSSGEHGMESDMLSTKHLPLVHRIPEACDRIGVGRSRLYDMIRRGEINAIKIGGRTLIPESELQRIVAEARPAVRNIEV